MTAHPVQRLKTIVVTSELVQTSFNSDGALRPVGGFSPLSSEFSCHAKSASALCPPKEFFQWENMNQSTR